MFKWLKNLLQKESKQESIPLDELEAWFSESTKEKEQVLTNQLRQLFEDISAQKAKIQESMVLLENAELRNKDIPPRAIQIMEGNRKTYLQELTLLLKKTNIDEINFESSKKYCQALQAEFGTFAKQTSKSSAILNEFFANEVKKILSELKVLEELNSKIMGIVLEEGELALIIKAEMIISATQKLNSDIAKANQKSNEIQKQLSGAKTNYGLSLKKIEAFKVSDRFKQIQLMQEEKDALEAEKRRAINEITGIFAQIEKPMKKYSKIAIDDSDIRMLEAYENPEKAIFEDKECKIIMILPKIKSALNEDKLDIDEKKKEKLSNSLDSITRLKLEDVKHKVEDFDFKINGLRKRLEGNGLMQELHDLEYASEHHRGRIVFFEQELDKNGKIIEKMSADMENSKNAIASMIKKIHDIELVINEPKK